MMVSITGTIFPSRMYSSINCPSFEPLCRSLRSKSPAYQEVEEAKTAALLNSYLTFFFFFTGSEKKGSRTVWFIGYRLNYVSRPSYKFGLIVLVEGLPYSCQLNFLTMNSMMYLMYKDEKFLNIALWIDFSGLFFISMSDKGHIFVLLNVLL